MAEPGRKGVKLEESGRAGTLYVVSTPIGHLADITLRALETLAESDLILAEDTRRTSVLLKHHAIEAKELRSYHKHNEAARSVEALARLADGAEIALVTDSGTPLVSDPGYRLIRDAIAAGARVVPIPGPSALLAALVGSGLDASIFTFLGFLPRSGGSRSEAIRALASLPHVAMIYESPNRLVATLEELARELGGERGVAVARELTKLHEEFVRGTLSEAVAYYSEKVPRGEIVICVAPASVSEQDLEAARRHALEMARDGSTSKEIVRELREKYRLERNRAYALALEAAEEGKS